MIKLNLLPPTQQDYLKNERLYLYFRRVAFVFFVFTILITGTLLAARILLQDNYASIITSSQRVNDHNYVITEQIDKLNQNLQAIEKIQNNFVKWSTIIVDLSRAIPPNAQLTYLDMEKGNGTFSLTGIAATRDDYLKLQSNLQKLPYIKELTSPLTNLLERTNVKFQFDGKLSLNQPQ